MFAGPASAQSAWPGQTNRSGVNGDPIIDRASVEAFGDWRGRPMGVAVVYTNRSDWNAMTRGSGWVFDNFSGFPGQLVISQGLVPDGHSSDLAACGTGQFDSYFRDFGSLMVRAGRADSIVRLGWEFNGDWFAWGAANTQQWIACYRRAALAIRAANPAAVFDWTINSKGTPGHLCGGTSTNCYPGDDVVDIVGIDNYDMGPSAANEQQFNDIADAKDGLNWLLAFARAHGKRFAVGEWGVAPNSAYNQTGDNDQFVLWMHQWFQNHAADLAYESYFNHCSADVGSNLYRSGGKGCPQNPRAGNMYVNLFGDPARATDPLLDR